MTTGIAAANPAMAMARNAAAMTGVVPIVARTVARTGGATRAGRTSGGAARVTWASGNTR